MSRKYRTRPPKSTGANKSAAISAWRRESRRSSMADASIPARAHSMSSGPGIPLSQPHYDARELERVAQALAGRTAGDGPFCRRVEERLEKQLGVARVLLTTSCTHAL